MLCLIIPCQDTFDDEEMTSEKLLQLENQKKKAKELQVQAMKDREEAELTVNIFFVKIVYLNTKYLIIIFLQRKKKDKQGAKSSGGSGDIFNAHDFEIDINVAEMTVRKSTEFIFIILFSFSTGLLGSLQHCSEARDQRPRHLHRPHQALHQD